MTSDEYDKLRRWIATAKTWAGKATRRLGAQHELETNPNIREHLAYEAATLLHDLLVAADTLVAAAVQDDDLTKDLEKQATDLAHRLRAHRLHGLMVGNTTGRTPDEIKAFKRKAEELTRR